jgi:glyoxylase-like metal-dependent hydrolase (beta-lactamase superfamily II)
MLGHEHTALVDSGYVTHQDQTLALVRHALGERPLNKLVNTHLHSDHCGGNFRLQSFYPSLKTAVPATQFDAVQAWRENELSYHATGQSCLRFSCSDALEEGQELLLGDHVWQVFSAPGHDPDSVILFQPDYRCLISADALWEQGFGVVFPELEGVPAFDEVRHSLEQIASLAPKTVIPGHGAVFSQVDNALKVAFSRLDAFKNDGGRHMKHAAKVLLKFKLMELQQEDEVQFVEWAVRTSLIRKTLDRYVPNQVPSDYVRQLLAELASSGVLRQVDGQVIDC